jgi:NAD(P)-dependent dehydrogenase (short-subunit alcohol dehydrogenase family)
MLLRGKSIIVSGIGPGLGKEAALALARAGADLTIGARTEKMLAEVAEEIRALGARVASVRTDITKADECRALVDRARTEYGRIDALVNNAFHPGTYVPFERDDLDDWRAPYEVTVLGTMRLSQAVIPVMKAQGEGAIIMVNSMIIRHVLPTMGSYAASKAALMAATQALARELGPHGIRVNSVVPGYIWGPSLEIYFKMQAKQLGVDAKKIYDDVASRIALGKIPTSEEIAGSIVFFASDLAKPITGQSLDVNGGEYFH